MEIFIDRQSEMATLEKQYLTEEATFVIVYGRRRVGKTSLINEFLKKHENHLYFLATEESEAQNLHEFKKAVAEYTQNDLLSRAVVDWPEVFKHLVAKPTKDRKIIVIDEFQYIGQSNHAFPSIMQKIWDTVLKNANVMLILCGSLISLMKSQTLDYSSPLYGRRTAQIKLKQIPFQYYQEFFPELSKESLIPFYAVTGGVPKYIESFHGQTDIYKAVEDNILNPQSFLYEEPYFLLQREVSEIGSYFSLIKAIAFGNRKLSEISSALGIKQTSLTKYLKVLMDLDLVEREVPAIEPVPEKSKSGLYRLTDNYIAFWFRFIYPYKAYLERGEKAYVISQIKKQFIQNYVSFVFEDICRSKMFDLSSENMWGYHFDKVGRCWGAKTGEIDIVAIDSAGKNIVLGECKYTQSEKGLSVFHELQEKSKVIQKLTGFSHIGYVIFSTAGFTTGLKDEEKRNTDIKLIKTI